MASARTSSPSCPGSTISSLSPKLGVRAQGQGIKSGHRARVRSHYVVEGSVRKAGDRVRVTVQLIDAETTGIIWAER